MTDVDEIPESIREQYEYDPFYCRDCEMPISLTVDNEDVQPQRYECSCTVRSPAVAFPEHWVIP